VRSGPFVLALEGLGVNSEAHDGGLTKEEWKSLSDGLCESEDELSIQMIKIQSGVIRTKQIALDALKFEFAASLGRKFDRRVGSSSVRCRVESLGGGCLDGIGVDEFIAAGSAAIGDLILDTGLIVDRQVTVLSIGA